MPTIRKRIEIVMHSEKADSPGLLAPFLRGVSAVYGAAQKIRAIGYRHNLLQSKSLPCRVIAIGNISAGGTGKTPMTIYLARELQQSGKRVAVISRGYKGAAEKGGGIVSDGQNVLMDAGWAGDEPFMMASRLKGIPVVVGKNRHEAGMLAIREFEPDVIVLDDAYQHLKLKRDINLVLLDHDRPFGNSHLLPRGILREPLDALARADACILTRSPQGADLELFSNRSKLKSVLPQIPVFSSYHAPYFYLIKSGDRTPLNDISEFLTPPELDRVKQNKVYGFSGIARNDAFQHTVGKTGFNAVGYREFDDHHRYSATDLEDIVQTAKRAGANCLISTEKDHARIAHQMPLSMDMIVVGVRIAFNQGGQEFMSFVKSQLK
ncbi:MAG: tetraacyldisaccharide 4'-kinase [Deltaproteobacteria bacterium]|nr:tetraacyldisaccharide 4'-kinase [Deltaproteobacteria bacterium]